MSFPESHPMLRDVCLHQANFDMSDEPFVLTLLEGSYDEPDDAVRHASRLVREVCAASCPYFSDCAPYAHYVLGFEENLPVFFPAIQSWLGIED